MIVFVEGVVEAKSGGRVLGLPPIVGTALAIGVGVVALSLIALNIIYMRGGGHDQQRRGNQ